MEKLVHSYLNNNYILENNLLDEIMEKQTGIYKYCLLDELVDIFSIPKTDAKAYADNWAKNRNPQVCLVFYWGYSAKMPSKFVSPGVFIVEHDNSQAIGRAARADESKPVSKTYYVGIDVANLELIAE